MASFPTVSAWLTHLETAHPVGIDMGLARITAVKEAMELELSCPVLTVGGTNGKGSTCVILEAILLHAGYRVACHTSPHLLRFNERVRIQGEEVSDEVLLPHFEAVEQARLSLPQPVSLTYFEFTTLVILRCFAAQCVEAVILEVGLGGRLDAMNVIDTDCAIITSIDIDHTAYLGDTREKIAFEKAGIFRPGKPAICADPFPPETLIHHAQQIGADLWRVGHDFRYTTQAKHVEGKPVPDALALPLQWSYQGRKRSWPALAYPALRGVNQLLNASAALAALEAMHSILPVSAQAVRSGLASASLPGRFQVLAGQPTVVLDVAHNPHAAAVLKHNLDSMGFFPYTYAVFGAMQDKDIESIVQTLGSTIDHWCVTDLPLPRAASAQYLQSIVERLCPPVENPSSSSPNRSSKRKSQEEHSIRSFSTPQKAYQDARSRAATNDRIVIFGSFYTVAGVWSSIKD